MCLLHACSSIHGGGWLGLVHQPYVREFASFESRNRRTGVGCVPGSETVSPQVQFAATPDPAARAAAWNCWARPGPLEHPAVQSLASRMLPGSGSKWMTELSAAPKQHEGLQIVSRTEVAAARGLQQKLLLVRDWVAEIVV